MNLQFFLGIGAGWLLTNQQGQKFLQGFGKLTETATKEVVKFGTDVLKETMPETVKLVGGVANAIPKSENTSE